MKLNQNLLLFLLPFTLIYSQNSSLTTSSDSGVSKAIPDINSGSDATNAINFVSQDVRNDSLITPCFNNLGLLIIHGNYTQTSDGALDIKLSPNGTSDILQVEGMASLDGGLELNFLPGIYTGNNTYDFIQASPVKGTFTQITSNNPITGIIDFETERVTFTLLTPQIVLSIENNALPTNQKHVANYLFSDDFPFENRQFVDLLQNLFTLPMNEYEKSLASLTPEIYGALSVTQNQTIYYITSLPTPTCITNKKNTFAVTPFYNISHYDKEKSLPNYQYNAVGFSMNISQYVTSFTPGAGLTYCSSDTAWQGESVRANTFNIYLYPSLTYHNENLFCNVTVLGGYTYHNVNRTLQFGDHIHMDSTPHSWELAAALHGGYTCSTEYVTFTPQLNFTQVNVFQSSIKENKREDISLKTASKNFRYLNMSLSLKLEQEIIHSCCSITPSLQFGWHNTRQLSDKNFNSKIAGYSLRKKYFITETYTGNTGLYFLEGSVGLSDRENSSLKLSYRAEFDTHVITSGLSAQIVWEF